MSEVYLEPSTFSETLKFRFRWPMNPAARPKYAPKM
jgi:hypothetical protein